MFANPNARLESDASYSLAPEKKRRFLIIEDEEDIANLIALHLQDLNAEVTAVSNGSVGLDRALGEHWDAIILDLQLPGMDGLELCRAIRSNATAVPVMMLTSRSTELDRVLGLEIGADDYMVKPFSIPELKARIKALLRRASMSQQPKENAVDEISHGKLSISRPRREAKLDETYLELTAKEFDLLWFFASQPGVVFKRSELLDKVWGYGHEGYEHTVNSHINRLRAKLEQGDAALKYIETVWGVGYRFGEH